VNEEAMAQWGEGLLGQIKREVHKSKIGKNRNEIIRAFEKNGSKNAAI
jgi:hypothetical protein